MFKIILTQSNVSKRLNKMIDGSAIFQVLCFTAFNIIRITDFTRFHVGKCKIAKLNEDDCRSMTHRDKGNPEEVGLVS